MCLCTHMNDAGEDRWLCTLLLKRGYRVEYSAASDVYTQCPENINEFYWQRRRWIPSTMANILDLLMNYKQTVKINDNISFPFILYQVCRSISINRVSSQNLWWFQLSIERRYIHAFTYKVPVVSERWY
jgi:cellulose synthase/poly-beta-1,6-N-acetylglucosamine synthase-like glycosyltransferase